MPKVPVWMTGDGAMARSRMTARHQRMRNRIARLMFQFPGAFNDDRPLTGVHFEIKPGPKPNELLIEYGSYDYTVKVGSRYNQERAMKLHGEDAR